jgi:hypothetical protein
MDQKPSILNTDPADPIVSNCHAHLRGWKNRRAEQQRPFFIRTGNKLIGIDCVDNFVPQMKKARERETHGP